MHLSLFPYNFGWILRCRDKHKHRHRHRHTNIHTHMHTCIVEIMRRNGHRLIKRLKFDEMFEYVADYLLKRLQLSLTTFIKKCFKWDVCCELKGFLRRNWYNWFTMEKTGSDHQFHSSHKSPILIKGGEEN